METSPPKPSASPSFAIESWDDDEDFKDVEELEMSKSSSRFSDRGSTPSRMSIASDTLHELGLFEEMERQVILPSPASLISSEDAVRSANRAGIPLPKDIPASALVGGSIRKLGGSRRTAKVDWGEDLELSTSKFLTVKKVSSQEFPLDAFQNSSEDERNLIMDEDDIPTIRLHKRSPRRSPLMDAFNIPTSETPLLKDRLPITDNLDDLDFDSELPEGNLAEFLAQKVQDSQLPLSAFLDSDTDELAEGSLGTRHGGRHTRNRSSSVLSTLSPSLASTFTMESEDEGFQCIELPQAFDFQNALEEKKRSRLLTRTTSDLKNADQSQKEDFFEEIEIGEGGLLGTKSNRNKNIKLKQSQMSPTKRTAVTLTFSKVGDKQIKRSRKLSISSAHALEAVDEGSGKSSLGDIPDTVKDENLKPPNQLMEATSKSRLRSQRSTPNLKAQGPSPIKLRQPLPPPKPPVPSIPRHALNAQHSGIPTMLPVRSGYHNLAMNRPSSRTGVNRPPSRTSNNSRAASRNSNRSDSRGPGRSPSRDRSQAYSMNRYMNNSRPSSRASIGNRSKSPGRPSTPSQRPPFLPAGASQQQSHHILSKITRQPSNKALRPPSAQDQRPQSRTSRLRERSPLRTTQAVAPESLRQEAASTNTLVAPTRKRYYGNGTELEAFDDLPTSTKVESKFLVQPVGQGIPRALRSARKTGIPTQVVPKAVEHDAKPPRLTRTPVNPAAEQRKNPMAAENINKRNQWRSRSNQVKGTPEASQKPQLITAAGLPTESKAVKDMVYNPKTFRWEGNEHAIRVFDKEDTLPTALPRPALISSVKSSKNIQVVGKMVFDPDHMCWLKVDNTGSDDEMNALAEIEDLNDTNSFSERRSARDSGHGTSLNELVMAEEFDVGPEFKRRQKEEEQRWQRKVAGWICQPEARSAARSWTLRDIAISSFGDCD